jgi:DNA-3-methyladenine glycosylase
MDEPTSNAIELEQRLERAFFERSTVVVARALLGKLLVHDSAEGRTIGRIVETEAYLGLRDPASHAYNGRTDRNRAMFGAGGHAYVYFIYGVHNCFNVVTRPEGIGEAVLVRALEPIEGIELMRTRRGSRCSVRDLCSGPGKLAQAMGLTREQHDGADLARGALGIFESLRKRRVRAANVVVAPRVGITRAAEMPLRFYLRGDVHVSKPRMDPRAIERE